MAPYPLRSYMGKVSVCVCENETAKSKPTYLTRGGMLPVRLTLQQVGCSRCPDTDSIPRALGVELPDVLAFRGCGGESA